MNDSKSERRHTVLKYVCGQVKPEPHLHWSPLKLRTRIYMRAARPPVAIVKKGFGSTSSPFYVYQGVHMQDKEHTESTGKICIGSFYS